ncbi:MAG: alpha/beta fold hydrolase [Myxococcales bacterium]|nr:MAG: alpha/beta fold hydrolase [Myxococcales bacterium]
MNAKHFHFILLFALGIGSADPAFAQSSVSIQNYKLPSQNETLCIKKQFVKGSHHERHIVLVHGLTYSSHVFNVDTQDYSLVRFLVQHGLTVWTLDLAGYGCSSKNNKNGFIYDTEHASKDLINAIRFIRKSSTVDKVHLMGWSFGTVVASRVALEKPQWLSKLVLFAPIVRGFDEKAPHEAWHPNTWQHAASDFPTTKEGTIDFSRVEPQVVHHFLSNCWKYDKESSPNGGRHDLFQGRAKELIALDKLRTPTLILGGDADPYLDWPWIEKILAQQKKTLIKLTRFKQGSHILMLEKQIYRPFRQALLDFVVGPTIPSY